MSRIDPMPLPLVPVKPLPVSSFVAMEPPTPIRNDTAQTRVTPTRVEQVGDETRLTIDYALRTDAAPRTHTVTVTDEKGNVVWSGEYATAPMAGKLGVFEVRVRVTNDVEPPVEEGG
jgi:hypothetical protein